MLETVERESPVARAISARLARPRSRSASMTRPRLSSLRDLSDPESDDSTDGHPYEPSDVCQEYGGTPSKRLNNCQDSGQSRSGARLRGMADDYSPTPVEDFLDPDDPAMFPRLTPSQIEYLAAIGSRLTFARGEEVFEHGSRETPLYVILGGALDIIERRQEGDRYFTQCREGTFAADISMFTGEPTLAAGVAAESTSVLALPPEDVRRVVATAPAE